MNNVIARLTITRANGYKIIVEVSRDATFHRFYSFYRQFQNKRSTKEFIRSGSRNEGITGPAHLQNASLELIASRLQTVQSQSNPVVDVRTRIIRKRAWKQLVNAAPDALGMSKITTTMLHAPHKPVAVPTFKLVDKRNHRRLHAGAGR